MATALLLSVIMLLIVGTGVMVLLILVKKMDPDGGDKTEDPTIKTAQEFLPFNDIRDDMIVLSGNRYRAVLCCTSINYYLKTEGEKDQIEMAFQRFLNTVSFPITFFLQTKVIDNTDRLKILKKKTALVKTEFPHIADYEQRYITDMENLNIDLGNNQEKKRYIIITYDEVDELSQLTESEKILHASKEIRNRCNIISSNLDAVGVSSYILNTDGLIELIYSSFYRDDYSYSQAIADKEGFNRFVDGKTDRFKDITKSELLDIILGEALSKMDISNVDNDAKGKTVKKAIQKLKEGNLNNTLELEDIFNV